MIRVASLAVALFVVVVAPSAAAAQASGGEAGSDDVAAPVHRVDLRTRWTDKVSGDDLMTYILRYERPSRLLRGDAVTVRVDLPINGSEEISDDPGRGGRDVGLGDVLVQLSYSRPAGGEASYGLGFQLLAPTASDPRFGSGKWRLVPLFGYRFPAPGISDGSYVSLQARYDFSFAGDSDRADVRVLKWGPNVRIALAKGLFVDLYPSTEMRYDFEKKSLFIPFNAAIGRRWNSRVITSLEGSARVFGENDAPYRWKLEARLGLYF